MLAPPRNFRLRPSAAALWVRCGGSVALAIPEPDNGSEDIDVREEGTACHWGAHETALGRPVKAGDVAPNDVEIDADMLDAIDMYLSHLRTWPVPVIHYEQPVVCEAIHVECGGTPDAFGFDAKTGTLYIADLKYGFRFVDAWRNWQMLCYFVGIAQWLGIHWLSVRTVVFTVVQPRCWSRDGYVRTWQIETSYLVEYVNTLRDAALNALQDLPLCHLNEGCRNCSGRRRCPTLRSAVLTDVDASFEAFPVDLPFEEMEFELHMVNAAIERMKAYASGMTEEVEFAVRRGARSRFFEMENGVTALKWLPGKKESALFFAENMGVNIRKEPDIITPTQAAKLMGAATVSALAARQPKAAKLIPLDITKYLPRK